MTFLTWLTGTALTYGLLTSGLPLLAALALSIAGIILVAVLFAWVDQA